MDSEREARVHRYELEWVRDAVAMKSDANLLRKMRGESGLFHWEFHSGTKLEKGIRLLGDIEKEEKTIELRCRMSVMVSKRDTKRRNCRKDLFELRESNALVGEFGLYAMCRHDRGDVITVAVDEDEKLLKKGGTGIECKVLMLGGSCAVDFDSCKDVSANALMTDNGVIRATRRINQGCEIIVDYHPREHHPVMMLDAVVEKKFGSTAVKGRVASYSGDKNGDVLYVVQYDNGKVEREGYEDVIRLIHGVTELSIL